MIKPKNLFLMSTLSTLLTTTSVLAGNSEGLLPTDENIFSNHLVTSYTLGAATGGGAVDLSDAKEVLNEALGITSTSNYQEFISDIDGDGKVSLTDVSAILKIALGIDEIKSCNSLSSESGNIYAFISESPKEFSDNIHIIENSDDFKKYITVFSENQQESILNKYENIFENYNIIVIRERVYCDNIDKLNSYTAVNGNSIMEQTIQNEINTDDKIYEFNKFCCIPKNLTDKSAKLILENSQVSNSVDIVSISGNGDNTADYDSATSNIHMLRNESDLKQYKKFLTDNYQQVDIERLEEYTNKMNASSFKQAAYVVFTYRHPSGPFTYKVTSLKAENNTLNVELKYIDNSSPDMPSEKDGINCVFVQVPVKILNNVTDVKLTVK